MTATHLPLLTVLLVVLATIAATAASTVALMLAVGRARHPVDPRERQRTEDALRESEERFRSMVDSLADGIVLQLADYSIAACNASAVRITGLTADQMLGRAPRPEGWLAIRDDGSRFDLREHPSVVTLQTGQPASCTMGVQSPGTEPRWMTVNTRPLYRNGDATPYAALSSVIDITDHVRAEEAERRAREAAEAASRAKSEFLANMSHEIRTPMNGVLGMLELVLGTSLEAAQREYLLVAQSSADSLLDVINDILDFSRVEAGRLELRPEPFSLADCVGGAIDPLAPRATEKGLELVLRIAPDVPAIVVGDAVRVRQVVTNLVGNAIKFTEAGEVELTVDTRPDDADDFVTLHVAVRDTGVGIPREKQALVFESFTQVDGSATRAHTGSGLGLAICLRLVDLMGGRMWLESEEGRGSTFHFTARFGVHRGALPDALDPKELAGLHALVVDDNGTNRLILTEMLTAWGMKATAVGGGRSALVAMEGAQRTGNSFDLLIVDGYMPDMDGFSLIENVRRTPSFGGATVLMLTSGDRQGGAERCRALGVAAHLLKPIKARELQLAIRAALGSSTAKVAPVIVDDVANARSSRPARILLAEDNIVNQKLAVAMLERWGHSVCVVEDGRAAIAAVARESFALILMDVQMPIMDGLRATTEIRASEHHTGRRVPIVAMTARTMAGDRERCLDAGMDAYVGKPFEMEELFRVIEATLAHPERPRSTPTLAWPRRDSRRANSDHRAAVVEHGDVIDQRALLVSVAGDRQLLRELVDLFRLEGPRRVAEIRSAAALDDADAVEAAAHSLRSTVGNLKAQRAVDAVLAIETMARQRSLDAVEAACRALEVELARLHRALTTFAGAA